MMKEEFRNILFKTAVFSMACDGEIHEVEIKELKDIANSTSYFKGIEYKPLLEELVRKIRKRGRSSIKEYFELIIKTEFSSSEELLILEVSLRIIQADKRIDQNEERFILILRRALSISDEILKMRFGNIPHIMLTRDGDFEEAKRIIPNNIVNVMNDIKLNSLEEKI